MKSWLIALIASCVALLTGCAGAPPVAQAPPDTRLFQDQLFAAPSVNIDPAEIFKLSPEMRHYADVNISHHLQGKVPQQALFDALYRKGQLKLEYDAAMTRNASQAFQARAGNCLSLVIMTAAMAREVGLTVQFQSVAVEDSWTRSGNLYFSSGHVNLKLGSPKLTVNRSYNASDSSTIDFLPPEDLERQVTKPIEEETVVAMYMNNRAAESLAQGQVDDAYWWARAAILHDPGFLNSYNTLGVVYQNHGDLAAAEQALRHAYQQTPDNTVVLFNLAQTLREQGRVDEARAMSEQLARLEPHPPFYYFNLGKQAMAAQDYGRARGLFARELARDPYYHEFHFWMAAASYLAGDVGDADKHMKLALENSLSRGQHDLYAAKLDRLKAYEQARARQ